MAGESTKDLQEGWEQPSKSELRNKVVAAWDKLGEETVKKSFICCGQSPASSPEKITRTEAGKPVQEVMEEIKKLWAQPAESLTDTDLLEKEGESKATTIESEVNAEEEDEDSDIAMVNDFNNNEHQK